MGDLVIHTQQQTGWCSLDYTRIGHDWTVLSLPRSYCTHADIARLRLTARADVSWDTRGTMTSQRAVGAYRQHY